MAFADDLLRICHRGKSVFSSSVLSQETSKNLTPKGREEYDRAVSNHVYTFAGEVYWTRFFCFSCFDKVFIKSSKMPPDRWVFLYLYPLEQCAPSKCSSHLSIFNLVTIHPLSPLFHLYFYKHLYLKG